MLQKYLKKRCTNCEHQLHTRLSPCVPRFCPYHILTSSVIDYWTDAREHETYLLNSEDSQSVSVANQRTAFVMVNSAFRA